MSGDSKSGKVPEGYIRFNANMKKELHKRLKIFAIKQDKTMSEIIEEWVEKYTDEA